MSCFDGLRQPRNEFEANLDKQRREREREKKTAYLCDVCREANRKHLTHPGNMHAPGICDCACRPDRP